MAVVKFNTPGEFLAELKQDCQQIDRGIVRVTNLYRGSTVSPSLHHLSVVATARVGRDLVRLDYYCGDLWQIGEQDSPHDQHVRSGSAGRGVGGDAVNKRLGRVASLSSPYHSPLTMEDKR